MLPNPDKSYGKHDWTSLGYKNNISPLVRHGFMGVISDNGINGKWFSDITQATHGDVPYTPGCLRFRYLPYYRSGTVVWTDNIDITDNNIKLVLNFIQSCGWPLPGNVSGEIQIIDNLLERQFGPIPLYKAGDVPNIPKRS